jgi:hypothetical protein
MDQINVDFRAFRKSHIAGLARADKAKPPIMPKWGVERDALKSTLSAGGHAAKKLAFLSTPLGVAEKKSRITWFPSPDEVANANPGSFTLGAGYGGSAGLYMGVLEGYGIYGSDSGEFGVYGTYGTMLMYNMGISGGGQVTLMKGAPSLYFAGDALGFGVDVSLPGGLISAGGTIYFDKARYLKKDYFICGISYSLSTGISVLPVTLSVQYSYTALKPLLLIK